MRGISKLLVLVAFFTALHWPRLAFADVTITGTVGEIVVTYQSGLVRFKLTDLNQTATCLDNNNQGTAKYAYFGIGTIGKEIFALLLYSKKGAPIICTVVSATNCAVTSCTLP